MGPTNMAAIKIRGLQKTLAKNNGMLYPVLFWDQWKNNILQKMKNVGIIG